MFLLVDVCLYIVSYECGRTSSTFVAEHTAVRRCLPLVFGPNTNKKCKNAALLCCKMHDNKLLCNYLWSWSLQTHQWSSERTRQDNGATCLNCKVDFLLEMLTTALLLSFPAASPPLTFEMQAVRVSHSARPPISHPHYLCSHALFPSLTTFLSLSLRVF